MTALQDEQGNSPQGDPAPTLNPAECISPSSLLGLTNTVSPRATPKSVSISNQPEIISPMMLGGYKNVDDLDLDRGKLPIRASSKRLSGRFSRTSSPIIRPDTLQRASISGELDDKDLLPPDGLAAASHGDPLLDQVRGWMKDAREKRRNRKRKSDSVKAKLSAAKNGLPGRGADDDRTPRRRDSDASESSVDLDRLEDILKTYADLARWQSRRRSSLIRHKGSLRSLRKGSFGSSDTDAVDGELLVPSCDVVLDNSKTLSYSAGGASDDSEVSSGDELARSTSFRDQDAWAKFKFEIVRLSHTLRLKGWRRVPMEMSNGITVQRLSGALTNAVYMVSPPPGLPERNKHQAQDPGDATSTHKKPPPKLLLRIYGQNVDQLIDRECELAILRRLAKKKIGPSLLGTFANGRFEEYFYAKTLTPEDLRNPDTSKQIAKRMRELHDGVELLDEERQSGPFVWRNWDKWVDLVGRIVTWLDGEIRKLEPGVKPTGPEKWKRRSFICGVPWPQFLKAVQRVRRWLEEEYGSAQQVCNQLTFAHNDTQYGNILRLMPTGESPLLLPSNTHKQLVVIDFEYANANTRGLEFANHFTEWCYDYHDAKKPYAFHANRYPTIEEQERFLRAYVRHRPQFNVATPKLAPVAVPAPSSSSSSAPPAAPTPEFPSRRSTTNIGDFILDARAPSSTSNNSSSAQGGANGYISTYQEDEAAAKKAEDLEIARLMHETRIWRLANTAQWVAWGIVQAKVPGMPAFGPSSGSDPPLSEESATNGASNGHGTLGEAHQNGEQHDEDGLLDHKLTVQKGSAEQEGEEAEDEFDYLGYSQHRAMFFWGDMLDMGLVEKEDLPDELLEKLKRVGR